MRKILCIVLLCTILLLASCEAPQAVYRDYRITLQGGAVIALHGAACEVRDYSSSTEEAGVMDVRCSTRDGRNLRYMAIALEELE